MSSIRDEKVICPRCGKINWYIQTLSFNSWMNPELFEEGATEHLNDFVCNECGLTMTEDVMMCYIPIQKEIWFRLYMAQNKVAEGQRLKYLRELQL